MFLDPASYNGGEPLCCASCKGVILGEEMVIITTPEVAGTYHPACAKPLLSVIRALEMLSRGLG